MNNNKIYYPHNKDLKPYINDEKAFNFVRSYLKNAKEFTSDFEVLKFSLDTIAIDGYLLEMGVYKGKTSNFIAALNPHKTIFGFDCFEGLPEDWDKGAKILSKGSFKDISFPPPVLNNVVLHKGFFKEVLPKFREDIIKDSPISFLHIDCDIYNSTKDIFNILGNNIVPGTIITFDEFYNYPTYDQHEFKAFQEFVSKKNIGFEYIAFNCNHEQVSVRMCNIL